MKTARYSKDKRSTGRAWHVALSEPGDIGETVSVIRKDGAVIPVTLTDYVERRGDEYIYKFREVKARVDPQAAAAAAAKALASMNSTGPMTAQERALTEKVEQAQAPTPMMASPSHSGNGVTEAIMQAIGQPIAQAAADQAAKAVEARLAEAIASMGEKVQGLLASQKQAPVTIALQDLPPVTLDEHRHPLFEKVLRLTQANVNVLLTGPAGCGKSHLCEQISRALSRSFGVLHCTSGASENQITGWLLPIEVAGQFTYVPAEFVRLYTEGNSVFLLDEIDAADPNMLMVINGALANGTLHVPHDTKQSHKSRGSNVAILGAANTFGTGADALYAGRNQLDAATLDRFYVIRMDYDPALEASIIGLPPTVDAWKAAPEASQGELEALGQWVLNLRTKVATAKLRRVVSTRTIQKALKARRLGIPSVEVKADILAGWTVDELRKVGE